MAKPNPNLADIEFICERVIWSLKLKPEELMQHVREHRMDAFHTIPNPKNGGMIIIGREAAQRFSDIATRFLASQPDKKARANHTEFVEKLRNEFSRRFLQDGREVDQANVDRMISAAYKAAARDFEAARHFIPCALFFSEGVKSFDVGPVKFVHESEFFASNKDEFANLPEKIKSRHQARVAAEIEKGFPAANAASAEQSAKLANHLVDGLLTSFREFNWFAVVDVPPCEAKVSYERALFAVKGALNIIKLLLGAQYTYRLRTAEDHGHAVKAAKLKRKADGELEISLSTTPTDNTVGENWLQALTNQSGSFFALAAHVLTQCAGLDKPPHLCARFIDALYWFGDAIAERSPAAKIVKFVSAIERIAGTGLENDSTGKPRGVTDIVTVRAAILHSNATGVSFADSKREIAQIYDCRSDLVHGSISPFDESVAAQVVKTHEGTRMIVLVALDFFNSIGLDDATLTEKDLRRRYQELEKLHASDIANADGETAGPPS